MVWGNLLLSHYNKAKLVGCTDLLSLNYSTCVQVHVEGHAQKQLFGTKWNRDVFKTNWSSNSVSTYLPTSLQENITH